MEQPANSPESSRPDGAELASRAEGGASASENKEEERLDSKALIVAADRGEITRVKEIIAGMKTNGVSINHQDSDGFTAFILACFNGHTEVVIELLKVDGIDVEIQSKGGRTALMMACSKGHKEVALELLKVDGIDVNIQSKDGWSALMGACFNCLTEMVIELLKVDGIDINIQNSDGYTALMRACSSGFTEVALELLKVDGLAVNAQSKRGRTALMCACFKGHADIALALLQDPRIDRHLKHSNGSNALALARNKSLTAVLTRIKVLERGDERMPLVKVHHRYLYGDESAEGAQAQAQAPHPPWSAITKTLMDKNLTHYISRFLAP